MYSVVENNNKKLTKKTLIYTPNQLTACAQIAIKNPYDVKKMDTKDVSDWQAVSKQYGTNCQITEFTLNAKVRWNANLLSLYSTLTPIRKMKKL